MPFLAFTLGFFLFATSGALTYLALRSWLHVVTHGPHRSRWLEGHWAYAGRAAGFACITLAALIGAVNDRAPGLHGVDIISLTRITGCILLLVSTPSRLRRRPIVGLAFASLLLGEALIILSAGKTLPKWLDTSVPLSLIANVFMDVGIALLWRWYTRTVLRVRLTDKLTLSFAVFSLFLVLFATLMVLAVVQFTLDTQGIDISPLTSRSLDRLLSVLFVAVVTGSAILSYFVARVLSAPVNRMAVALRSIGGGDLDYRLRGIRSRDEMQDLAREINEMAHRLKEADAVRTEFVSFASHELRNPLTAVKGFVDTLSAYDTSDSDSLTLTERQEIYEIIQSECDRLLRMTNELLETSRVEAGVPLQLHVSGFDARKAAVKVVDIMRTHTEKHQLKVSAPEQPLIVEGDMDKIEQILINLLSNAIKYSPRGGPIDVIVEDRGNTVEFSVRDQGMGMTPDQAEHVFDKFYRIQERSRQKPSDAKGTGIGLYLTRALVNAHGGNIRVRSVPDEGSTFIVTIPKRQSAVLEVEPEICEDGAEDVKAPRRLPLISR